jgi:hypothetical protein
MAFFGAFVPAEISEARRKTGLRELTKWMLQNGMNGIIGGPSVTFKGLGADGKAILDFNDCDAFFKEIKEAGCGNR